MEDPGNHRSVSLTSVLSKVIEQIIVKTISRYTKDKKVMRRNQHGFNQRKSCLTSFITFHNEMTGFSGEEGVVDIT